MFDDDSEASHMDEIYDEGFKTGTYTEEERRDYVRRRSNCFRPFDVGKFVIRAESRYNRGVMPYMYLVDRRVSDSMWWSPYSRLAVVFDRREVAERVSRRLRYNNPSVVMITGKMTGRDVA